MLPAGVGSCNKVSYWSREVRRGMDRSVHRRWGGGGRRLKLVFCCSAGEETSGLDLEGSREW